MTKRDRIVTAARAVAHVVGYDGMTMRQLADGAGMSTATVYRHFSSKAHVLVAVWSEWLNEFDAEVRHRAESVPVVRLRRSALVMFDRLRDAPGFADAVIRAYSFADAHAADEVEGVRLHLSEIFAEAVGGRTFSDRHLSVGALMADVWVANALAVSQGRATAGEFRQRLSRSAYLLTRAERCAPAATTRAIDSEQPLWITAYVGPAGAIPVANPR